MFDAVLDRTVSEGARAIEAAAQDEPDPLECLRIGCATWLRLALDPAVQQIVLLDAPSVVGWPRWRELDEQHILGGVRQSLEQIGADRRLPAAGVNLLSHMIVAAVNEAALLIAEAEDRDDALARGQAAVDTLVDGLAG